MDYKKRFDVNYQRNDLFNMFEEKLGNLDLVQSVNFDTWERLVGSSLRSSLLDHIYVKEYGLVRNLSFVKPCFGDHVMVMAECCLSRPSDATIRKRDWRKYSK